MWSLSRPRFVALLCSRRDWTVCPEHRRDHVAGLLRGENRERHAAWPHAEAELEEGAAGEFGRGQPRQLDGDLLVVPVAQDDATLDRAPARGPSHDVGGPVVAHRTAVAGIDKIQEPALDIIGDAQADRNGG